MANNKFLISDLTSIATPLTNTDYTIVERNSTTYKTSYNDIYKDAITNHLSIGVNRQTSLGPNVLSIMYRDNAQLTNIMSVQLQDGMLSTLKYNDTSHILSLYFNTTTPEFTPNPITVSLDDLKDIYSAGYGLSLNNNIFSVKSDEIAGDVITKHLSASVARNNVTGPNILSINYVNNGQLSNITTLSLQDVMINAVTYDQNEHTLAFKYNVTDPSHDDILVELTSLQDKLTGREEDVVYLQPDGIKKQPIFHSDVYLCENEQDFTKCKTDKFSFKNVFNSWIQGDAINYRWLGFDPYYINIHSFQQSLEFNKSYAKDLFNGLSNNVFSVSPNYSLKPYSDYFANLDYTYYTYSNSMNYLRDWSLDTNIISNRLSMEYFDAVPSSYLQLQQELPLSSWKSPLDWFFTIISAQNNQICSIYVSKLSSQLIEYDNQISLYIKPSGLGYDSWVYNDKLSSILQARKALGSSFYISPQSYASYELDVVCFSPFNYTGYNGIIAAYTIDQKTQHPVYVAVGRFGGLQDKVGRYKDNNGALHNYTWNDISANGIASWHGRINNDGNTAYISNNTISSLSSMITVFDYKQMPEDLPNTNNSAPKIMNGTWQNNKVRIKIVKNNDMISAWSSEFVSTNTSENDEGMPLVESAMISIDLSDYKSKYYNAISALNLANTNERGTSFGFLNSSQEFSSFKILNIKTPKIIYRIDNSTKYTVDINGNESTTIGKFNEEIGIGRLLKNEITGKTFYVGTSNYTKIGEVI